MSTFTYRSYEVSISIELTTHIAIDGPTRAQDMDIHIGPTTPHAAKRLAQAAIDIQLDAIDVQHSLAV